MRTFRIAFAGFGGVGRATASLLLSRRARYREIYGADTRLVAVCGSRSGARSADGLEEAQFSTLEEGFSGPAFIEETGADVLIEAGPNDFRTGVPGLAYLRSSLSGGRDTSSYRRALWFIAAENCARFVKARAPC